MPTPCTQLTLSSPCYICAKPCFDVPLLSGVWLSCPLSLPTNPCSILVSAFGLSVPAPLILQKGVVTHFMSLHVSMHLWAHPHLLLLCTCGCPAITHSPVHLPCRSCLPPCHSSFAVASCSSLGCNSLSGCLTHTYMGPIYSHQHILTKVNSLTCAQILACWPFSNIGCSWAMCGLSHLFACLSHPWLFCMISCDHLLVHSILSHLVVLYDLLTWPRHWALTSCACLPHLAHS